ncbi:hypothetical protein HDU97_005070 [Phlyctochytrium planicorne]|nr:hypothetical protein HDU97_005070 [Phlyctochytrium planicorne]
MPGFLVSPLVLPTLQKCLSWLVKSLIDFHKVYGMVTDKWENDAAMLHLKDRMETLAAQMEDAAKDERIRMALQAFEDLARRLQAVFNDARQIVEKYLEAKTTSMRKFASFVDKVSNSKGYKSQMIHVHDELNACTSDLHFIISMKILADSQSPEERNAKTAKMIADIKANDMIFQRAIQEDIERLKAENEVLIRTMDANNGSRHADMGKQLTDVEAGIHSHLSYLQKQLRKAHKSNLISSTNRIEFDRVQDFEMEPLHTGTNIIVERCTYVANTSTKIPCIYKHPSLNLNGIFDRQGVERIDHELATLRTLDTHPYFPTVLGRYDKSQTTTGILIQYVGDGEEPLTLRQYLSNNLVEWSERLRIMRQVVSAVSYMHGKNIIHNSLSTLEILVASDATQGTYINIIGFGQSIEMGRDTAQPVLGALLKPESYPFIAPEIFQGGYPAFSADIYALGTILWEIAYCTVPFDYLPSNSVRRLILNGEKEELPCGVNVGAPVELVDIIARCWNPTPFERPSADEIDNVLFDIYHCDVATSEMVKQGVPGERGVPNSIKEWRREYLKIRSGMSVEDILCIRVISSFWDDPRLPSDYLPSDRDARRNLFIKWLEYGYTRHMSGGAAHMLAKVHSGVETSTGREWLEKAAAVGHPSATMELAAYKVNVEKTLSKEDYEKTFAEVKSLSQLRNDLGRRKTQRRTLKAQGMDYSSYLYMASPAAVA